MAGGAGAPGAGHRAAAGRAGGDARASRTINSSSATHLLNLAKVHQALDQPAEAIRATREAAALSRRQAEGPLQRRLRPGAERPAHSRESQQQALAAEAVQTLEEAIAAGWNDAGKTSRDPDLAPLRDRDDFRRLLAELFDRGFPADPFAE